MFVRSGQENDWTSRVEDTLVPCYDVRGDERIQVADVRAGIGVEYRGGDVERLRCSATTGRCVAAVKTGYPWPMQTDNTTQHARESIFVQQNCFSARWPKDKNPGTWRTLLQ